MLWEAGQRRVNREGEARLRELYVGVRDGYIAAEAAAGRVTMRSSATPAYLHGEQPRDDARAQRAALGRLSQMFPGNVKGLN